MVSGINISSLPLSGIGKAANAAAKTAMFSYNRQNTSSAAKLPAKASQTKNITSGNSTSAIVKAVQKKESLLTSGNTGEFLQTVERLIDASLPGKPPGTRLRINLDKSSGRFVYQGVDIKTGKVLTQFPADEILKQLAFIRKREGAHGIVVDKKV